MRRVYLDANATTRAHPEVIEAMSPFYGEKYGNASSAHAFGREAKKHLDRSRQQVSQLIHADSPEEIVFTSGGTESDNLAVKGTAYALKDKGNHIITSSVEHKAVLNTCKYLEDQGFQVTYLGVDRYGIIDPEELRKSIRDDTILITIMSANNETGTILPVEEIGRIAGEKNVVFHTDAVQTIGKMPFDVHAAGADLVSLSAHKINGPKGIGALYIKKGTKIVPCHHGGHHENGRRAGTENIPAAVGLGLSCEIAATEGQELFAGVGRLRDMLRDRIEREIGQTQVNSHPEKCLPNTLNISFRYLEGEAIVLGLDSEGIAVSTGSACTSGELEPSHVLKSMGVELMSLRGAIRFSLDRFNTESDIDYVMKKLPPLIGALRKLSPGYKEE
ncbi:MAG: cysteine desulfurase NifS [Candidatus Makaraimicrobium thalassicum]|nr:MAG: cysteine desulfurase NifS [Candidatus Omnitrophota bacterium]